MNKSNHPLEHPKILELLQKIQENPDFTQRDLSSYLDMSLGKVNFLLKALFNTGLIRIKRVKNSNNKLAYMYLLTPRGIEEKAKITYRFLKEKTKEYNRLKKEIEVLKEEIALNE